MNRVAKIQRQFTVAELYLQGHTRNEIAKRLEMPPSTVSADIASLHKLWSEPLKEKAHELRARELSKLDLLESLTWERYLSTGLSAHSKTILKIVELRAKLNGLLVKKVEVEDNGRIPWDKLYEMQRNKPIDPVTDRLKQMRRMFEAMRNEDISALNAMLDDPAVDEREKDTIRSHVKMPEQDRRVVRAVQSNDTPALTAIAEDPSVSEQVKAVIRNHLNHGDTT